MTVLVDTNVLLYAAAVDYNLRKNRIAIEVLARRDCVLSAQCVNEFMHQSTRESRPRHLTLDQALAFAAKLRRFNIVAVDTSVIDKAAQVAQQTNYGWWDSLIVAATIVSGCDTLLTEDLQHGRVIDGVRIENPFRDLA